MTRNPSTGSSRTGGWGDGSVKSCLLLHFHHLPISENDVNWKVFRFTLVADIYASITLILLSTAWPIGIASVHSFSPPLAVIGLLAVLPLASLVLWRDDAKVRPIAACSLFLLLGSARYTLSLPDLADPGHIAAYTDQGEVTLWGRVVGEPDVHDTYTNLRLAVDRVRVEGEEHLVKGRVLVRAPHYPGSTKGKQGRLGVGFRLDARYECPGVMAGKWPEQPRGE